MAKAQKSGKDQKKIFHSPFKDYWNRNNYLMLIAALGVLMVGYFLMGQGKWDNPISLSVSPVVLLLVYLVLIPLSIFIKKPVKKEAADVPGKN